MQCTNSEAVTSANDNEELSTSLGARNVRQVYLLTYSQANEERFPTRRHFADAVIDAFKNNTAQIEHWVCARENHSNGGIHYHLAVKLDRIQRWLTIRNALHEEHGINVHFSSSHYNYYSAWSYVTKEDDDVLESDGHPDLRNAPAPRTSAASRSNHNVEQSESDDDLEASKSPKKKKRLSSYQVSEIIINKNIKTRTELLVLAQQQKQAGKSDLAEFIVN